MKSPYSFLTFEQFEEVAQGLAGTCNTTPYSLMDYYKPLWGLTEEQSDEVCASLEEHAEQVLEIFKCNCCGWYGHGGELLGENSDGEDVCFECLEEEEEEDDF